MTRIFIVDDHPIMRQMLAEYLGLEDDMTVCGEAASAEEALQSLPDAGADLALIDILLPGMSGIELALLLHKQYPDLPVAMLSGHSERSYVEGALKAGARGYLLKGDSAELPSAIRQMMRGDVYLSSAFLRR